MGGVVLVGQLLELGEGVRYTVSLFFLLLQRKSITAMGSWMSLDVFDDDLLAAGPGDLGADGPWDYHEALLRQPVPVHDRLVQDHGIGEPDDAVGEDEG